MLGALVNLVFGCRHKRTTRPITPVHKLGETAGCTYVACLDCGKRLRYDLTTMQIGKPLSAPEATGLLQASYAAESQRRNRWGRSTSISP